MARRRFQNPSVLEREGAAGREYYFRYSTPYLDMTTGVPKIKDKQHWHVLGLCKEMTMPQAKREKARILQTVNSQPETIQSQIQFSKFTDLFLANHAKTLSVPTQGAYRQAINKHIVPALGHLRLCDIGPLELEQLFRIMEGKGLSLGTRNSTKGILTSIFGCAKRWKYLEKSPMPKNISIGGGKRHAREVKVPTLDQLDLLIKSCEGDVPLLLEFLYTTGVRISEAAGLFVSDLKFDRQIIEIRKRLCRGNMSQTKSESGVRDLGMGHLVDRLRAHVAGKQPGDYVFTWAGEPICDNNLLTKHITPIMRRLGIYFAGFGFHTLRRMHITEMAKHLSIFDLKRQAGHANVVTTQRYVVDSVERRAEAVKSLPRIGEKPPEPTPAEQTGATHGSLFIVKKAG